MSLLNGKLSKLKIYSYKVNKDGDFARSIPTVYEVMYNPTTFSKNLSVQYHCKQAPSDSTKQLEYSTTNTGDVTFDFMFDATGASTNSEPSKVAKVLGGVDAQIELFHRLTSERDPQTHQTAKLKLVWGTFIFNCRLKSAKVEYLLFNPNGRPLRAKINATFEGDEPRIKIAALQKLFSADLTHVHLVKAGETLPGIAREVYENESYYLEIAKVNNLKNFRKLIPGTELILPPVNKQEN